MAQKAAKQQAVRNAAILKRTHRISVALNLLFIFFRFVFWASTCTTATYVLYAVLSFPAFMIEFWLEKIGKPRYARDGELKRAGEDLEAKGLTEYLWDVLYWSWGCTALAALFGDRAWWMWATIPLYSAWLAYTTFGGMRQSMAGLAGQTGDTQAANGAPPSNRQKKLEKRGGQKMQHR